MATRRARILVVEDEEALLDLICATLLRRGYQAEAAPGGHEALEAIRERPPFDLAILDIRLPGLSGSQLLRYLETESPDTEVVVITGCATPALRMDSVAHGAFAFLEKPFRIHDLLTLVDRLLQSPRSRA